MGAEINRCLALVCGLHFALLCGLQIEKHINLSCDQPKRMTIKIEKAVDKLAVAIRDAKDRFNIVNKSVCLIASVYKRANFGLADVLLTSGFLDCLIVHFMLLTYLNKFTPDLPGKTSLQIQSCS